MVDITLLGTAATMPTPERFTASTLLSCQGHSILFDCGEGTQIAARKQHLSLMKVDIICLTHYHGDHIFGLPGLLQTYGCLNRTEPLYICGPEGLSDALAPILALAGPLAFQIKTIECRRSCLPHSIGTDTVICSFRPAEFIAGWPSEAEVSAFETVHRVASCGYRFSVSRPGKFDRDRAVNAGIPVRLWGTLQHGETVESGDGRIYRPEDVLGPDRKGLSVVITGDSAPCPGITTAAAGADLLICDGTYGSDDNLDQANKYGHCTFTGAADTAAEAGVNELWLTHFSQIMEDPEEFLPIAQNIFADTVCGYDGMGKTLHFRD